MMEVLTGTTIVASEYDRGVVVGADSRITLGDYIPNRVADKITKITETIYCLLSGSVADTQAVADLVKYQMDFHRMEMSTEPLVKTVANIFKHLCYDYRDKITASIIVAGWDSRHDGQVYSIPLSGVLQKMPVTIGGSGSDYLYGYIDANFKAQMTKEQSLQFVANSVSLAINRDGYSGGVIRLACISRDGVERHVLTGEKMPKFFEDS